jgi:hypothetical protein
VKSEIEVASRFFGKIARSDHFIGKVRPLAAWTFAALLAASILGLAFAYSFSSVTKKTAPLRAPSMLEEVVWQLQLFT